MKNETNAPVRTRRLETTPHDDPKIIEVAPEDTPRVYMVVTERPDALQDMIEQAERVSQAFVHPAILDNEPLDTVDDLEPVDRFFYRMAEYVTTDLRKRATEEEPANVRAVVTRMAAEDVAAYEDANTTFGNFLSRQNRPLLHDTFEMRYDDNFIAIPDTVQAAFNLAMATMPEADNTLTTLFNICDPVFEESAYRRDSVTRRDRALYADMQQLLKIYTLSALYTTYEEFAYNEDMLFEWQYAMFHFDFVAKLQDPARYQHIHDLVLDVRVRPDSVTDEDFEPEVEQDRQKGPVRITFSV